MNEELSDEERKVLVSLTREAVILAAHGEQPPAADLSVLPPRLSENGASFVTLMDSDGQLRGCIGTIDAHAPLAHDVQRNAVSSATRDPRFLPLEAPDLEGLCIELSILTSPRRLDYDGPDDLLAKIRPGMDGLLIEKDWHRATLLPSVWDKIPNPVQFLNTLCYKAGLPDDAWRGPEITVYVYQTQKVTAT